MCLFGFVCFNGACGFHVNNILIDYIFQVCVFIMFLYKAYVSGYGHVSISMACFYIESMFYFKVSCSFYNLLIFFVSMALCLCVSMFHYFHPFKRHSSKNYIIILQASMFHLLYF